MIPSLTKQLIKDLREMFEAREDEYKDTIVKEIYRKVPKGDYPKILVEEIDNYELISRSTIEGEQTTRLVYQFKILSRGMQDRDEYESTKFLANLVQEFISTNYKMQRTGGETSPRPYINDDTVMELNLRFSCVYDKPTDKIYVNI